MPPTRKQGPRPGDATGREKARLEETARPAIEEAATRVALTNAPVVERSDEVIDYTGGGAPSAEQAASGVRVLSIDEALDDGQTAHTVDDLPESALNPETVDALPDGKTDVRQQVVERAEEPQPAARFPGASKPPVQRPEAVAAPVVEQQYRIMRVNTDLPDVTIGKDNHYTFRAVDDQGRGIRYKVPAFVYDHLDERGYVYH